MATKTSPLDIDRSRILDVVRHTWGFETLRPLQEEAIRAGIDGRDSLVVMPTGGGKSLCYQVPPLLVGRTDIVVSPLISLMKDQVDALEACGYPAAALHSGLDAEQRWRVEERIASGACRLVFVAPERLLMPRFLDLVDGLEIGAFAVDEAHCISHWGHDFRPEYRQLAVLKERFPGVSLHAYTATATERVRDDVIEQLRLEDPTVLVGRFDRPNLVYRVVPRLDLRRQLREVLARHRGEAAIVYCISRADTERLAAHLAEHGHRAAHYHAGMEPGERRRTQDDFAAERVDIVVATVAFGMGIDRSDVRCVVHAAMPKSIEHYQQETGRAGRDGLEAECVLLYSPADTIRWRSLLERDAEEAAAADTAVTGADAAGAGADAAEAGFEPAAPGAAATRGGVQAAGPAGDAAFEEPADPAGAAATDLAAAARVSSLRQLDQMHRFCAPGRCRHRLLSEYFGQAYECHSCEACDVCLGESENLEDGTEEARMILSCVARVGQNYGVGHVVDVLRGADTERVRSLGHDRLSTHGLMADIGGKRITNMVYQLVDQELLVRTEGEYPVLKLNDASVEVLRGERDVKLVPTRSRKVRRSAPDSESWEDVDADLFEALRRLRTELARQRNVPPYVIFSDRTLREMARHRPSTPAELLDIHGVGDKKLADLGDSFLAAIAAHEAASDRLDESQEAG